MLSIADNSLQLTGQLDKLPLGHKLKWEKGRQLKSFDSITYTYNASGIRTSRTYKGVEHKYTLDGTKILRETWGANTLVPLYDNSSSVCGIVYNGKAYFFIKNLQGDVIAVTDKDGETVAEYAYDAWGDCIVIDDRSGVGIANINPFRYRGYYLDIETGLYYLQSRYYNPTVGRFINADKNIVVCNDLIAYALYAYCGNNPIVRLDENGMFWSELLRDIKIGIKTILHVGNTVARKVGIDTAKIGAFFLQMDKDGNNVYHATFDCWQQYAGYNSFYDFLFDVGTSMSATKFPFLSKCKSYIFWIWKGDYINLGAGAELGIYYGGGPHWFVDKSLALPMTLTLWYRGLKIISYSAKTWWITGFNPKYLNVDQSELTAIFSIDFSSKKSLFWDFYISCPRGKGWTFNKTKKTATFTF